MESLTTARNDTDNDDRAASRRLQRRRSLLAADGIDFDADVWDLSFRSTTAVSPSSDKFNFGMFLPSIRNDVKAYVLEVGLGGDLSNGWIRQVLATIRTLTRVLAERHGPDYVLTDLTRHDAAAVEDRFRNEYPNKARWKVGEAARFTEFLRDEHNGQPEAFRPDPLSVPPQSNSRRSYTEGLERVIPAEVSAALMAAIGRAEQLLGRSSAFTPSGRLKSEHLYVAATKLLVFSGRRISEILLLPRECLRRPTPDEERETGPGVWLRYNNTKYRLGLLEAFITEPAATVVQESVERILGLTASLAERSGRDRLFLTDAIGGGNGGGHIRTVSAKAFTLWLNGRMTADCAVLRPGFVHRNEITYSGAYYQLEPHQTRHTHAHQAYLGGASYVDVGDHLHHKRTKSGLSPVTGVYLHGHVKDVQHIREMHERRLLRGRAVPLVQNRMVAINDLDLADVAVWREQGMIVLPTHYGHCILPEAKGPCVCGDPCWIGPKGDGCDYALYSPESRESLLKDKSIYCDQLADIERRSPHSPLIGHVRTRLARIDVVLDEIEQAQVHDPTDAEPFRPRAGLVPSDGELAPGQPTVPIHRAMRQRRREAALRRPPTGFLETRQLPSLQQHQPIQVLDEDAREWASKLLDEIEAHNRPITLQALAARLGVSVSSLHLCPEICDRVAGHRTRQLATLDVRLEARLDELRRLGQEADYHEFAALCGVVLRAFFNQYPEWCARLAEHNASMRDERLRSVATRRLEEVLASGQGMPLRAFAKQVHIDPGRLRQEFPEIARWLVEHNRLMNIPGIIVPQAQQQARIREEWDRAVARSEHLSLDELAARCKFHPGTIRRHCPDLLLQLRKPERARTKPAVEEALEAALAEVEQAGAIMSFKDLAATAGISTQWLQLRYGAWHARLDEHNRTVVESRLQQAWTLMEQATSERWTLEQFAQAAYMDLATLLRSHPEWAARVKERSAALMGPPAAERIRAAVESALASMLPVSAAVVARQAGVVLSTFMRQYPELYARALEHERAVVAVSHVVSADEP